MATQTLPQTQQVPSTAIGHTQDAPEIINGASSGALSALDALSNSIETWAQDILDRFFPPEQREALLAKTKVFVLANPRVSAFLGMNIALTGIPLVLFTLFGLSVAVFSVLGGIIMGLLGAVLVTLTCVGLALTVVFPILMFTTASACFLFLFGLGGYKILEWASGHDESEGDTNREQKGMTVGEGLKSITGGRLTGLLDSAKAERGKDDIKSFSDEKNPPPPPSAQRKGKDEPVLVVVNQSPVGEITKRTPQITSTPIVGKTVKATSPIAQKNGADEKE